MFKRVIAAVDGRRTASRGLRLAVDLAREQQAAPRIAPVPLLLVRGA